MGVWELVTNKLFEMAPFDRAHYQLEDNIVGFAALLDAPPDVSVIAQAMDEYVASCPKLRWQPVLPKASHWQEADGFCGSANLRHHQIDTALTARHLFDTYDQYRDILKRKGPPWRIIVVEAAKGGVAPAAIVMLCHHSVGDGFRMSHFLISLQGVTARVQIDRNVAENKTLSPLKKCLAHAIAWPGFGFSAIDALVRSIGHNEDIRASNAFVFHKCLDRRALRKLARKWNCSNETACYLLAAQISQALDLSQNLNQRIIAPLVFKRSTYMETFGSHLIPFEFTFKGVSDTGKGGRIDQWRARVHSWLTPFGLKTCAAYINAGLSLASILPASIVQRMRRGWAYRFSASCTVVPFPARRFVIGGTSVSEIMCFTPQLSKLAPAITFTTYRNTVSVIVRYPAEIDDAEARIKKVLP